MQKIFQLLMKVFKNKNIKYGSITLVLIAFVTAIALFINLLVGMTNVKWDLTPEKLYSIGDQTKGVLENLDRDVTIYGLFDDGKIGASGGYKELVELLEHYEKYPHVTVDYIDLDKRPDFVTEIDPDNVLDIAKGTFVVKSGAKVKILESYDLFNSEFDQSSFQYYTTGSNAEQGFTGAVKYVTSDNTPVVYFTEGHGEAELDRGMSIIKDVLDRNNFDISTLNILTSPIPEDATTIIMVSPKQDLLPAETSKLTEYLKNNGGNLMILFDPIETNVRFAEFNKLLEAFNLKVNSDRIRENDSNMHIPSSQFILVPELQSSNVTPSLSTSSFQMLVPESRSIDILKNSKEYIEVKSLLATSDKAESLNIEDSSLNKEGKLNIAAAVDYKGGYEPSKLLVTGNSTFISDDIFKSFGYNALYFFMDSLMWMQGDAADSDLYIAPKNYSTPTININAMQSSITSGALVIILPLIIFGLGIFVYLRRRHL